jgi:hypothetical protein
MTPEAELSVLEDSLRRSSDPKVLRRLKARVKKLQVIIAERQQASSIKRPLIAEPQRAEMKEAAPPEELAKMVEEVEGPEEDFLLKEMDLV